MDVVADGSKRMSSLDQHLIGPQADDLGDPIQRPDHLLPGRTGRCPALGALTDLARVVGDLPLAVEDYDLRRAQRDPDGAADELRRDGVVALTDRDAGVAVDSRGQSQPVVERLDRQRSKQGGPGRRAGRCGAR